MICPSCQAEVGAADIFCAFCGTQLASSSASFPAATAGPLEPLLRRHRRWGRILALLSLHGLLIAGSTWGVYRYLARRQAPAPVGVEAPATASASPEAAVAPAEDAGSLSGPATVTPPRQAAARASQRPARAKPLRQQAEKAPAEVARGGQRDRQTGTARVAGKATSASSGKDAGRASPAVDSAARVDAASAAGPAPAEQLEQARAAYNADSARMVVQQHHPQVRMCYDRAQKQMGPLSGMIEIQFTIEDSGEVKRAQVRRNTTGHEGLGGCLAALFKRWRFPIPVGGAADLVYPFLFSPEEE